MSILNGNISGNLIYPEKPNFGTIMEPVSLIDVPSVTVAALENDIIICGGEKISLYRILNGGHSEFISEIEIIGKARQIAVKDNFAYITARENGVYVCDMTCPKNPKIIYNIDTIELATGIAVADNLLAVTSRHMGCEIFDIANPTIPVRIGHFMCGEAQSVCLYDNYAVIGDWMNKRARIFDISDIGNIKELSQMYVDGFADGVCTLKKDGKFYCVIATGHHSAKLKNRRKYENYTYVIPQMLSEGYGCGHGIEIYDITNPESPEWVSGIKAPPLFGGLDTWLVFTDGKNIVFTDSMNGVFVISLNDINSPSVINSYRLPALRNQKLSFPSIQIQTGAVTGTAMVNGYLCTASEQNGVHILKPDIDLSSFLTQTAKIQTKASKNNKNNNFYTSNGQIHSFVQYNDRIYCASGNAGIEVLDCSGNLLYTKKTQGICRDIIIYDTLLICAESGDGIAVYNTDDTLTEQQRFSVGNSAIRQIVKTKNGIAAVSGLSDIIFFSKDDNNRFTLCFSHHIPGILYHRHLSGNPNDESIIANPLSVGPIIISENDGNITSDIVFDTQFCPFSDGACFCGNKLISIYQEKYFISNAPYTKATEYKIPDASLDGQPFFVADSLVLINRYNDTVEIFDISTPEKPLLTKHIRHVFHPEFCGTIGGRLYVACGYDGIFAL